MQEIVFTNKLLQDVLVESGWTDPPDKQNLKMDEPEMFHNIINRFIQQSKMIRYICSGCYFTYDPKTGIPEHGIAPGTSFSDLPDDWVCPECGLGKESFREYKE